MVKFTFNNRNGLNGLVLGISRENVNRLIQGKPIHVNLKEMNITVNGEVIIYFAETEQELVDAVKEFITPETKVDIDPRLSVNFKP